MSKMILTNAKVPEELEAELSNAAARLGLKKSVLHRAGIRSLLASDPSRREVLRLDGASTADLRKSEAAAKAQAALARLGSRQAE